MILRDAANFRCRGQLSFEGRKNNIILSQIIIYQLLIRVGFLKSIMKIRLFTNQIVKSQNLMK